MSRSADAPLEVKLIGDAYLALLQLPFGYARAMPQAAPTSSNTEWKNSDE